MKFLLGKKSRAEVAEVGDRLEEPPDSQKCSPTEIEPLKPVSLWHMIKLAFGLIPFGHFEYISNSFISPLARDLVNNATQVGLIQALNPMFGFLVQPVIGWFGDHTWTRMGRRKPYLLFALPFILVALIVMPLTHGVHSLLWFILAVVVYQFFVDMYAVSCSTMMPETVPGHQRSRQASVGAVMNSLLMIFALTVVGRLYDKSHLYPFALAALITTVSTAVLVFGIKELSHGKVRRPPMLSLPLDIYRHGLKNRNIRIMFLIILFGSYGNNSVAAFYTLFVRESLGGTVGRAVFISAIGAAVGLVSAVPLGLLADRFGKKNVLIFSSIMGITATLIALTAQSFNQMYYHFFFAALGHTAGAVAFYPLMTQFMPRNRIGTISGSVPFFFGGARFLAMLTAGMIIDAFGENYRVIYWIALACSIPAFILLLMVDTTKVDQSQMEAGNATVGE